MVRQPVPSIIRRLRMRARDRANRLSMAQEVKPDCERSPDGMSEALANKLTATAFQASGFLRRPDMRRSGSSPGYFTCG